MTRAITARPGLRWHVLTAAVLCLGMVIGRAGAAGEQAAVYGADLTPAERQEVTQQFGLDASASSDTVTITEIIAALQNTGLSASPNEQSISSAGITCLDRGQGLTVRTQNITRITAPIYANALVTAGVGDASVRIAAPVARPVTGEAALVGVLKAFPQCQAGRQPEQARVQIAYEQIARTMALGDEIGDLNKASTILLRAAQPVVTRQARDEAAIGNALDQTAAAEGVQLTTSQRAESLQFLRRMSNLDYGTYAQGYEVRQSSPNEVQIVPAGAGAPGAAGQPAGGQTFTGQVASISPLTARTGDQTRALNPDPNVVVTRNGNSARLGDIQPGDSVSVTTNPAGASTRIDARSGPPAAGFPLWLLALLALLLLAALAFWLLSRRRDKFVLEPTRSRRA